MKYIVQLFVCMVVLAHGTLLSEQIGQITVGDTTFICEHYMSSDQSPYLSRESFNSFLPTIIKNGTIQIQKEIDNPESTFTIGELSVSDYICAYYNYAYGRFQDGDT